MALVKFDNEKRERSLSPGLTDMFESLFNDSFISDRMISKVPAVNISETEKNYHIELAVPGLKKDDFKINLERNTLSISAETKAENENKKYNRREYSYTSFVRSFTLPEEADSERIEADYVDGVLRINVAKKEEATIPPKQISIK